MFKSSRECLQRVQDQQQLPALVNSCFTEAFLPVPKRADAVPSRLKKCGGKELLSWLASLIFLRQLVHKCLMLFVESGSQRS